MRLREADVSGAIEDPFQAYPPLDACQWATWTGVRAASERDVRANTVAVDAELGRALELVGIAVGGTVQQHDRGAGGDLDAADRRRAPGQPEVGLDRALDAQRLLDELRYQRGVLAQLVLVAGILREVLQGGRQEAGGRLLAGCEQERRSAYDRGHLRRAAVGVGRACHV